MPEYVVLRCAECSLFQSTQRRKDSKFKCKVCGAFQSVKKLYAQSHKAADLRPIVQQYNLVEGKQREQLELQDFERRQQLQEQRESDDLSRSLFALEDEHEPEDQRSARPGGNDSKWWSFVDERERREHLESRVAHVDEDDEADEPAPAQVQRGGRGTRLSGRKRQRAASLEAGADADTDADSKRGRRASGRGQRGRGSGRGGRGGLFDMILDHLGDRYDERDGGHEDDAFASFDAQQTKRPRWSYDPPQRAASGSTSTSTSNAPTPTTQGPRNAPLPKAAPSQEPPPRPPRQAAPPPLRPNSRWAAFVDNAPSTSTPDEVDDEPPPRHNNRPSAAPVSTTTTAAAAFGGNATSTSTPDEVDADEPPPRHDNPPTQPQPARRRFQLTL